MAIENTFKEQGTNASPAAYFAALTTTLESTVRQAQKANDHALADGDLLPAQLYLLSIVVPYVPSTVIKANLDTIVSLTAPLWPTLKDGPAPPLRSQLAIYTAIIRVLDRTQLEMQSIRQSFAFVLQLAVDHRPKVRKLAIKLVSDVLASPPTPLVHHPYESRVAEWMTNGLVSINGGKMFQKKSKPDPADPTTPALHIIACLRQVYVFLRPSVRLSTCETSLVKLKRLLAFA